MYYRIILYKIIFLKHSSNYLNNIKKLHKFSFHAKVESNHIFLSCYLIFYQGQIHPPLSNPFSNINHLPECLVTLEYCETFASKSVRIFISI